jgi:hypothetical protein
VSREERPQAKPNAGAFLGPDMLAAVPMRTLSDEYHDAPTEPEDDFVPAPEPPGVLRRIIDRLTRRSDGAR